LAYSLHFLWYKSINFWKAQGIVYADIGEVRMERKSDFQTRAVECNKLLKEGWVLLGVYPLTTLGDMTASDAGGAKGNKQQEGQRYVRRLVGYVVGRRREP
jgi:hypothetical protein